MRVLVSCLSLLALAACARSNVPLGVEDNATAGGNPSGDDKDDAGSSQPVDSGSNSGGKPDSGSNGMAQIDAGKPNGMCAPASCTSPMDAGEIIADVDGAPVMVQGMGHAFIKVFGKDGQSTLNSAGGVRATLNSTGGNYDLYAYGGASDACADLSLSSSNPAGQADTVAPIWGVNGPAVAVDWTLTFEVRPADGQCDAGWTLTLQGNPCEMTFVPNVPKSCP